MQMKVFTSDCQDEYHTGTKLNKNKVNDLSKDFPFLFTIYKQEN